MNKQKKKGEKNVESKRIEEEGKEGGISGWKESPQKGRKGGGNCKRFWCKAAEVSVGGEELVAFALQCTNSFLTGITSLGFFDLT